MTMTETMPIEQQYMMAGKIRRKLETLQSTRHKLADLRLVLAHASLLDAVLTSIDKYNSVNYHSDEFDSESELDSNSDSESVDSDSSDSDNEVDDYDYDYAYYISGTNAVSFKPLCRTHSNDHDKNFLVVPCI